MKNQYVGDISDFEKYSILRALQMHTGLPLSVCWMLTDDDGSGDGRKLGFLDNAETYRARDPHVFDCLRRLVSDDRRDVAAVDDYGVLAGANFYTPTLGTGKTARDHYFERYFASLAPSSLVFFDPDNGIASQRLTAGAKNSAKFLFPAEIERAFRLGHSLVIYQHWGRVARNAAIQFRFAQLQSLTGAAATSVVWGRSRVAFYIVPQPDTAASMSTAAEAVAVRWTEPDTLHHTRSAPPPTVAQ